MQRWKKVSLSKRSEEMLSRTSAPAGKAALLVLEDGTYFEGRSCGVDGEVYGEICFNTSVIGYLEVISDPSYAGQIITMTYPQIGNYGVNRGDLQADNLALRGLVLKSLCRTPSNWRSELSLFDFLRERSVVAIEGIDTRSLTKHIRDTGAKRAVISTEDTRVASLVKKVCQSKHLEGENLVATVSTKEPYRFVELPASQKFALHQTKDITYSVIAYDCGAKRSILAGLVRAGCAVEVVSFDTPAEVILAKNPDGVFVSNGPGDPDAVETTYSQIEKLLGKIPLFGVCLGHQMICRAAGARIEKMKFGHHGGNQPVMNLLTHRVEITAQNHGFNLDFSSLGPLVPNMSGGYIDHPRDLEFWISANVAPVVETKKFGRVRLTHVNLNDKSAEGIAFLDVPAFSVQYHPEASPGSTDAHYLFSAFDRLMCGRKDYLDIDIAKNRLKGWKFTHAPLKGDV
jgi:carbamoyl-phosphate synthase small subunit